MSDHDCPTCGDSFDSERAVKVHHTKAHGESIVEEFEKTCPECGETFLVRPKNSDQIHCSVDCKNAGQLDRVTVECEHCADEFEVKKSDADGRRWCDRDCRREAQSVAMDCEYCGETFRVANHRVDRRHYCSQDCRVEDHKTTVECAACEQEFEVRESDAPRRTYCSDECRESEIKYPKETIECQQCGDLVEGRRGQKYCDMECCTEAMRKQVEIDCATCGESFQVAQHREERRTYCSWSCKVDGQRRRVEHECEYCGESFETVPKRDPKYCSLECHKSYLSEQAADIESRSCRGCGYTFRPDRGHRDQQFCTKACWHECQRKPHNRPDTVDGLLVDLYHDQDCNHRETHKRLNTALQHGEYDSDYISLDGVRDRLQELGIWSTHLDTYKAVLEAGQEADDDAGDESWKQYYHDQEGVADD